MQYRTEFLLSARANLARAEARMAEGDYQIDPADDLARILGCTTEQQCAALAIQITNLRAAIARAESMTDSEFGESWTA